MTYTTEQLLAFLDQELRATWRGERVVLSSVERLDNPVIAKALGADKLSKVFAFQDFQAQIHAYQRQHGVSGLVWHTCYFAGQRLRVPELHPQLIAIPADKLALTAAKPAMVQFWQAATPNLRLWQAGRPPQPITADQVNARIATCEWAELSAAQTELYLSLCWGDPKDCHYDWAQPDSGCTRIIAAPGEPSGIKV
ncbi:MAG: hypothetical protein VKI82_09965 [Leptolyngbya sp.]|nr:hypothetical protein [Leptolyngbya sp.]